MQSHKCKIQGEEGRIPSGVCSSLHCLSPCLERRPSGTGAGQHFTVPEAEEESLGMAAHGGQFLWALVEGSIGLAHSQTG